MYNKILTTCVCILLLLFNLPAQITQQQWKEDIDELILKLEKFHPKPYHHFTKDQFYKEAELIKQNLSKHSDIEIQMNLMQLVSKLRDGHTEVRPSVKTGGFDHWLPISIYKFSDGYFVVSGIDKYQNIIGKKILKFGTTPVEEVFQKTADLMTSDNDFGRDWSTFYMCSMEALKVLNIAKKSNEINLFLEDENGKQFKQKITAENVSLNSYEYRFWGEMFGPDNDQLYEQYQMAYQNLNVKTWNKTALKDKTDLPLYIRSRRGYWYDYLDEHKTMYVAFCYTTSGGRHGFDSFIDFYDKVFEIIEEKKAEKFILDLRYNSGGDGSVVIPFIHKFIRSDRVNQKGKLFTLTGRKTYSAAQMVYAEMLKHTKTILVGEPAGAPLNGYGDPMHYKLTHSKMHLQISSVYWQMGHPNDNSWHQKIDIPAVFTSKDYLNGNDPAVSYILSLADKFYSLPELLRTKSVDFVSKEYETRKSKFGKYEWWKSFDEREMRYAARELYDEGKVASGELGFEMLTNEYPQSWRAWRDYAKRLIKAGEKGKAKLCLEKGLKANEGSTDLKELLEKL